MKKLLPFLALLSLFVSLSVILDTYAIFETDVSVNTSTPLADWQIAVNGSVLGAGVQNFTASSVNWTTNPNVLPGKASPGLDAYFEIIINPSGSKVAIDYEIGLDFESLNNEFIEFTSIKDSLGNDLVFADSKYHGGFSLADVLSNKVETIRVNFSWINDESNNQVDSTYVNQLNAKLSIPVTIKLSQRTE